MAETNGGAENGKVTVALLGQKIDQLISRLDKLDAKLDKYVETTDIKCSDVKMDIERVKAKQESRDEDIAELKKKSETWSIINSVVGFVALVAAAIAADLGIKH